MEFVYVRSVEDLLGGIVGLVVFIVLIVEKCLEEKKYEWAYY